MENKDNPNEEPVCVICNYQGWTDDQKVCQKCALNYEACFQCHCFFLKTKLQPSPYDSNLHCEHCFEQVMITTCGLCKTQSDKFETMMNTCDICQEWICSNHNCVAVAWCQSGLCICRRCIKTQKLSCESCMQDFAFELVDSNRCVVNDLDHPQLCNQCYEQFLTNKKQKQKTKAKTKQANKFQPRWNGQASHIQVDTLSQKGKSVLKHLPNINLKYGCPQAHQNQDQKIDDCNDDNKNDRNDRNDNKSLILYFLINDDNKEYQNEPPHMVIYDDLGELQKDEGCWACGGCGFYSFQVFLPDHNSKAPIGYVTMLDSNPREKEYQDYVYKHLPVLMNDFMAQIAKLSFN